MNDPWDDLRELPEYLRTMGMLLERYEQGGRGRLLYTAKDDVANLLTDAAALLAVVRAELTLQAAEENWKEHQHHAILNARQGVKDALAALPEHLRRERIMSDHPSNDTLEGLGAEDTWD